VQVSNKLSTLVWGAKPFASGRSGLAQRLIMASLADQVDEVKHGDFCYPSRQVIEERTELSRRTVMDALARLAVAGWLAIEHRSGYGNLYRFDVVKLTEHQRAKRDRGITRTRAYLAPVQIAPMRGADCADEGGNLAHPNIEESAFKPAEETAAPRLVLSMPSTGAKSQSRGKQENLSGVVTRVFAHYLTLTQHAYELTPKRMGQGLARAREMAKKHGEDLGLVESQMRAALDNLAANQWHVDNDQVEWHLVMRDSTAFDTWLNKAPRNTAAGGQQRRYKSEDYGAA
jgi:hypothetical protein